MVVKENQGDEKNVFLNAARSGKMDRVFEYLKTNTDINTCNKNGLNALHLASKNGHLALVEELVKRGANINALTKKGNTALHIASLAGQYDIVKHLIESGASVNIQSLSGFTPLYMAAQENHEKIVEYLLANGANQSLATEDGFTPITVAMQQGHDKVVSALLENDSRGKVRFPALHIAAKRDDAEAANLLLENGHNPDVTSKSGFTPLHIASHYGNKMVADILVQKGANVNFAAKHSITPLHVAAKWGKITMVQKLLNSGGRLDAKTKDGLMPLHCAARSGHDQVVELMLERGAEIRCKTKNGLTPLHMAAQGDHVNVIRILLHYKAPVDEVTVDYLTPLHISAHCGHFKAAKLLLEKKADANAMALNGYTPLHIACKKNKIKIVEILLNFGARIGARTETGLTPLHVASFMGCMNIVIFLLQYDADTEAATIRGETALHLAVRANQTDIVRILLRNGAQVDALAREKQTPLHVASRIGNVDIVMLLLQHGAQVDNRTKDDYTALHIAAKEGQDDIIMILIDNAASINTLTKKEYTPLHLAVKNGHLQATRILLEKHAPINTQDRNGFTPFQLACFYDHQSVALLLLDRAAGGAESTNPSMVLADKNGHTALHIAAKKNQIDLAHILLERGADPNAESKTSFTPLHFSVKGGFVEMSELFVEHKANVDHKSKTGLTALHLCAQEDSVPIGAMLVRNGANVKATTKHDFTPLHFACHYGQMNMVKFLLEHGADVNAATILGYTPLHQAVQQGHASIVEYLLKSGSNPNLRTKAGQTPLDIATQLGYITVIDLLKPVTEASENTAKFSSNEMKKYKIVTPEAMFETIMSDSDDESSEDIIFGDQPYKLLTDEKMETFKNEFVPFDAIREDSFNQNLVAMDSNRLSSLEKCKSHNTLADHSLDTLSKMKWKKFLVSFIVDAKGGAMQGERHLSMRLIIPPNAATSPTRVMCRYARYQKSLPAQCLMEGEALVSKIIELSPIGLQFMKPVVIEVPHFASLRGKEREIIIMCSENGTDWTEYINDENKEYNFDKYMEFNSLKRHRIVTESFPQYFALVSRIRREIHVIGPEGGTISSTVVPDVQIKFPVKALTKKIKVGLQVQRIDEEEYSRFPGHGLSVSPLVTLEPRRRKFHKPITICIPLIRILSTNGDSNKSTLRLLCSITGGNTRAQWEDVTNSTEFEHLNDCVIFTTTVSARFWLIDYQHLNNIIPLSTNLYREVIRVPFLAKFIIFAKRTDTFEASIRILCMTDDKDVISMDLQQNFYKVGMSQEVELLEGKLYYIEFAGNLIPITKSDDLLNILFLPFFGNRKPISVRLKDQNGEFVGHCCFNKEPKVGRGVDATKQQSVCVLPIRIPDIISDTIINENFGVIPNSQSMDFHDFSKFNEENLLESKDIEGLPQFSKLKYIREISDENVRKTEINKLIVELGEKCPDNYGAILSSVFRVRAPPADGGDDEKGDSAKHFESLTSSLDISSEISHSDLEELRKERMSEKHKSLHLDELNGRDQEFVEIKGKIVKVENGSLLDDEPDIIKFESVSHKIANYEKITLAQTKHTVDKERKSISGEKTDLGVKDVDSKSPQADQFGDDVKSAKEEKNERENEKELPLHFEYVKQVVSEFIQSEHKNVDFEPKLQQHPESGIEEIIQKPSERIQRIEEQIIKEKLEKMDSKPEVKIPTKKILTKDQIETESVPENVQKQTTTPLGKENSNSGQIKEVISEFLQNEHKNVDFEYKKPTKVNDVISEIEPKTFDATKKAGMNEDDKKIEEPKLKIEEKVDLKNETSIAPAMHIKKETESKKDIPSDFHNQKGLISEFIEIEHKYYDKEDEKPKLIEAPRASISKTSIKDDEIQKLDYGEGIVKHEPKEKQITQKREQGIAPLFAPITNIVQEFIKIEHKNYDSEDNKYGTIKNLPTIEDVKFHQLDRPIEEREIEKNKSKNEKENEMGEYETLHGDTPLKKDDTLLEPDNVSHKEKIDKNKSQVEKIKEQEKIKQDPDLRSITNIVSDFIQIEHEKYDSENGKLNLSEKSGVPLTENDIPLKKENKLKEDKKDTSKEGSPSTPFKKDTKTASIEFGNDIPPDAGGVRSIVSEFIHVEHKLYDKEDEKSNLSGISGDFTSNTQMNKTEKLQKPDISEVPLKKDTKTEDKIPANDNSIVELRNAVSEFIQIEHKHYDKEDTKYKPFELSEIAINKAPLEIDENLKKSDGLKKEKLVNNKLQETEDVLKKSSSTSPKVPRKEDTKTEIRSVVDDFIQIEHQHYDKEDTQFKPFESSGVSIDNISMEIDENLQKLDTKLKKVNVEDIKPREIEKDVSIKDSTSTPKVPLRSITKTEVEKSANKIPPVEVESVVNDFIQIEHKYYDKEDMKSKPVASSEATISKIPMKINEKLYKPDSLLKDGKTKQSDLKKTEKDVSIDVSPPNKVPPKSIPKTEDETPVVDIPQAEARSVINEFIQIEHKYYDKEDSKSKPIASLEATISKIPMKIDKKIPKLDSALKTEKTEEIKLNETEKDVSIKGSSATDKVPLESTKKTEDEASKKDIPLVEVRGVVNEFIQIEHKYYDKEDRKSKPIESSGVSISKIPMKIEGNLPKLDTMQKKDKTEDIKLKETGKVVSIKGSSTSPEVFLKEDTKTGDKAFANDILPVEVISVVNDFIQIEHKHYDKEDIKTKPIESSGVSISKIPMKIDGNLQKIDSKLKKEEAEDIKLQKTEKDIPKKGSSTTVEMSLKKDTKTEDQIFAKDIPPVEVRSVVNDFIQIEHKHYDKEDIKSKPIEPSEVTISKIEMKIDEKLPKLNYALKTEKTDETKLKGTEKDVSIKGSSPTDKVPLKSLTKTKEKVSANDIPPSEVRCAVNEFIQIEHKHYDKEDTKTKPIEPSEVTISKIPMKIDKISKPDSALKKGKTEEIKLKETEKDVFFKGSSPTDKVALESIKKTEDKSYKNDIPPVEVISVVNEFIQIEHKHYDKEDTKSKPIESSGAPISKITMEIDEQFEKLDTASKKEKTEKDVIVETEKVAVKKTSSTPSEVSLKKDSETEDRKSANDIQPSEVRCAVNEFIQIEHKHYDKEDTKSKPITSSEITISKIPMKMDKKIPKLDTALKKEKTEEIKLKETEKDVSIKESSPTDKVPLKSITKTEYKASASDVPPVEVRKVVNEFIQIEHKHYDKEEKDVIKKDSSTAPEMPIRKGTKPEYKKSGNDISPVEVGTNINQFIQIEHQHYDREDSKSKPVESSGVSISKISMKMDEQLQKLDSAVNKEKSEKIKLQETEKDVHKKGSPTSLKMSLEEDIFNKSKLIELTGVSEKIEDKTPPQKEKETEDKREELKQEMKEGLLHVDMDEKIDNGKKVQEILSKMDIDEKLTDPAKSKLNIIEEKIEKVKILKIEAISTRSEEIIPIRKQEEITKVEKKYDITEPQRIEHETNDSVSEEHKPVVSLKELEPYNLEHIKSSISKFIEKEHKNVDHFSTDSQDANMIDKVEIMHESEAIPFEIVDASKSMIKDASKMEIREIVTSDNSLLAKEIIPLEIEKQNENISEKEVKEDSTLISAQLKGMVEEFLQNEHKNVDFDMKQIESEQVGEIVPTIRKQTSLQTVPKLIESDDDANKLASIEALDVTIEESLENSEIIPQQTQELIETRDEKKNGKLSEKIKSDVGIDDVGMKKATKEESKIQSPLDDVSDIDPAIIEELEEQIIPKKDTSPTLESVPQIKSIKDQFEPNFEYKNVESDGKIEVIEKICVKEIVPKQVVIETEINEEVPQKVEQFKEYGVARKIEIAGIEEIGPEEALEFAQHLDKPEDSSTKKETDEVPSLHLEHIKDIVSEFIQKEHNNVDVEVSQTVSNDIMELNEPESGVVAKDILFSTLEKDTPPKSIISTMTEEKLGALSVVEVKELTSIPFEDVKGLVSEFLENEHKNVDIEPKKVEHVFGVEEMIPRHEEKRVLETVPQEALKLASLGKKGSHLHEIKEFLLKDDVILEVKTVPEKVISEQTGEIAKEIIEDSIIGKNEVLKGKMDTTSQEIGIVAEFQEEKIKEDLPLTLKHINEIDPGFLQNDNVDVHLKKVKFNDEISEIIPGKETPLKHPTVSKKRKIEKEVEKVEDEKKKTEKDTPMEFQHIKNIVSEFIQSEHRNVDLKDSSKEELLSKIVPDSSMKEQFTSLGSISQKSDVLEKSLVFEKEVQPKQIIELSNEKSVSQVSKMDLEAPRSDKKMKTEEGTTKDLNDLTLQRIKNIVEEFLENEHNNVDKKKEDTKEDLYDIEEKLEDIMRLESLEKKERERSQHVDEIVQEFVPSEFGEMKSHEIHNESKVVITKLEKQPHTNVKVEKFEVKYSDQDPKVKHIVQTKSVSIQLPQTQTVSTVKIVGNAGDIEDLKHIKELVSEFEKYEEENVELSFKEPISEKFEEMRMKAASQLEGLPFSKPKIFETSKIEDVENLKSGQKIVISKTVSVISDVQKIEQTERKNDLDLSLVKTITSELIQNEHKNVDPGDLKADYENIQQGSAQVVKPARKHGTPEKTHRRDKSRVEKIDIIIKPKDSSFDFEKEIVFIQNKGIISGGVKEVIDEGRITISNRSTPEKLSEMKSTKSIEFSKLDEITDFLKNKKDFSLEEVEEIIEGSMEKESSGHISEKDNSKTGDSLKESLEYAQSDDSIEQITQKDVNSKQAEVQSKLIEKSHKPEVTTETSSVKSQATIKDSSKNTETCKKERQAEQRRHSDSSENSFEMVETPSVIDDFVVIEEVGKEALELDPEGRSLQIVRKGPVRRFDTEVDDLCIANESPEDNRRVGGSCPSDMEFDLEDIDYFKPSPETAEQQVSKLTERYQYETTTYELGPLEDIKEEDINEGELSSSRINSVCSHKFSNSSHGSFKNSYSSTFDRNHPKSGDDVSVSSLQEFENFEKEMEARKLHAGSHESPKNGGLRTYMLNKKSEEITSSLKEFEGLEQACIAVHNIEIKVKEEEEALLEQQTKEE